MNIWKLFLSAIVAFWTLTALGGCGEQHSVGTEIGVNRTFGTMHLKTNAGDKMHIGKVAHYTTGTTTQPAGWECTDVTVEQEVVNANGSIPQIIDANGRYRLSLGQEFQGDADAIGRNFVQPLTGLGLKYLENRALYNTNATQLGMTKYQVAESLMQGMFNGQVDLATIKKTAEPAVVTVLQHRLDEIEAELAAQRKTPAAPGSSTP